MGIKCGLFSQQIVNREVEASLSTLQGCNLARAETRLQKQVLYKHGHHISLSFVANATYLFAFAVSPFPVLSQSSLEVEMVVVLMSVREALSRQSSAEPWLAGYCD